MSDELLQCFYPLTSPQKKEKPTNVGFCIASGAENEIRTRGTVSRTQPFQGCTLNHSDISACALIYKII